MAEDDRADGGWGGGGGGLEPGAAPSGPGGERRWDRPEETVEPAADSATSLETVTISCFCCVFQNYRVSQTCTSSSQLNGCLNVLNLIVSCLKIISEIR